MKRIIVALFLLTGLTAYSSDGQKALRTIENKAFKPGELLKFNLHYGFISAGEATLEVKPDLQNIGGRDCYHVVGTGESTGAFNWFFKVHDRYESLIDKDAMIPWLFIRRVNEGGYIINQNVSFNHYADSAKSDKKAIAVPDYVQDMVSAAYYARTLNFTNVKEGDIFEIHGYLDDQVIPFNIKFIGRETVSTKVGKVRCIKFRPMLQQGRVFKEKEDMTVWVSDDSNHIPIRVQTEVLIGSIKMDLVEYQNLMSDLALEKK